MKLKFRAEKKDWIMFGIYAVVLLYFVAIAVLNISQFAAGDIDKPLHGFNPFPAFGPRYIGITLILYVVALVASVLSVSDRFFDREKGLGFSTESKKEKGYSKWLEEKELKSAKGIEPVDIKAETAEYGGIPLINNGKKMWVDNSEGHNIIIGSTGAGKSQITMFPLIKSLAKHDESMIVTDPKGELYEGTSNMLRKRGYNVVLLNFRDPQKGSGWNPLHLPYQYYKNGNKDKANELVDDLALNILYDQNAQNQDPFWEKTSADYFSGLCLALFEDASEEEINLNSVNMFTTVGEEKCGPNTTYVNEYFNTKDHSSPAYISASSTLIAPNDTKGSILSVFKQKLRLFAARENISEMLSHSDFEMADIGSKKTAVFIVIQDEKKTYHPLVTIFVKQCYETLVDYAQKCGGKLPYRTNFLLDEFANMPPLKDVETMVSAARSRKMRFFFVIQNFAQLSEVYGKNKGDTIRGNCTNIIYLISTEIAALEEISKMCGEVKVKTGSGDKEKEETRPLITVSDLQKLKMGEVILLRSRLDPFRTKLKLDYEIDWGPLYATADGKDAYYPEREKQEIKIFDLKGYVNKKKEERINQIINGKMGKSSLPNKTANPSTRSKSGAIDFEAITKRIDARIAELEAEEAKEKAKLANAKTTSKSKSQKIETVEPTKPTAEMISKFAEKIKQETNDESNKTTKKQAETLEQIVKSKAIEKQVKPETKSSKEPAIKESEVPKEEIKPATPKKSHVINKQELANKITNNINIKTATEKESTIKKDDDDYITDDQFFDDFFADDDDDI